MNYRDEFEKIIEGIKISPNAPKEEVDSQFLPVIQFIRKNVPEQLYKFRGCAEYSIDAFEKDELWLSKASFFNDLHDSLLFFDKNAILDSIEEMFSSGSVSPIIESIKQVTFPNADLQKQAAEMFSSLDTEQLTDIVRQSVPDFSQLLDQCFSIAKDGIREQTKMACLSESIKSPLMWAHYADNHKGFAIGYDFRNNEITQCSNCPNRSCTNIKQGTIYPMIYSDKRYDATRYGQWIVQQQINHIIGIPTEELYNDGFLFTKAALHKSNDWSYENEWRIICSTPNLTIEQKDRYPIKKRPIAIYLGSQIPNYYRKMLMHIADEKGIPRYQMYVKNYSSKYELDYMPI
ncbi:MAG: DUF2971 domain-containing protein [Lachnospiraceae bacterium]|nr:DUF2971 domain-containing protein [Lachnospiraceae bacterium]